MGSFTNFYTAEYVEKQQAKFNNRHWNHWQHHIKLAKQLLDKYAPPAPASLLDLGCSIGTFALEFALDGYNTLGLDFDPKALAAAKRLAQEMGLNPKWVCKDAGSFCLEKKVDIVICFDLLEHLSDDVIAKAFLCIKKNLQQGGVFIFHTFPTQYDHVFYKGALTCLPLIPFRSLSEKKFEMLVRLYAGFLNVFYLLRYGKTHQLFIANTVHPNPLSRKRLWNFLEDAGFEILLLEMGLDEVNPLKPGQGVLAKKYLAEQPVVCRSLWGAARTY